MKIIFGVIAFITVAAVVSLGFLFNPNKTEASQTDQVPPNSVLGTSQIDYCLSDAEQATAQQQIGEVTNETTFIQRMLEMSLQKVQIGNKPYEIPGIPPDKLRRIQMTPGNIQYLREKLDLIKTTRDQPSGDYTYEDILNRWLAGNFSDVVNDVKTLMSDMLKPNQNIDSINISPRSLAEENKYITQFFGS